MNKQKISTYLLILFLIFFFITQVGKGYNETKNLNKELDVIKTSMDWFEENSNNEDKILVGDPIVYQYFTDNQLYSYSYASQWAVQFCNQNKLNDLLYCYAAFLYSNEIKYLWHMVQKWVGFMELQKNLRKTFKKKNSYLVNKR